MARGGASSAGDGGRRCAGGVGRPLLGRATGERPCGGSHPGHDGHEGDGDASRRGPGAQDADGHDQAGSNNGDLPAAPSGHEAPTLERSEPVTRRCVLVSHGTRRSTCRCPARRQEAGTQCSCSSPRQIGNCWPRHRAVGHLVVVVVVVGALGVGRMEPCGHIRSHNRRHPLRRGGPRRPDGTGTPGTTVLLITSGLTICAMSRARLRPRRGACAAEAMR